MLSTCILSAVEVNDLERREEGEDERLGNNNSCISYSLGSWWPSLSWLHFEKKQRLPSATPEDRGHSQKSGGASRGVEKKSALCWWEATAGGSIQPGGPTRLQNPTPPGAFSSEQGKARKCSQNRLLGGYITHFQCPFLVLAPNMPLQYLTFKMPS